MPPFDFFALGPDHASIVALLFAVPGARLWERDSAFDRPLREFAPGSVPAAPAVVWLPEFGVLPKPVRVELDPKLCGGHTFRECLEPDAAILWTPGRLVGGTLGRSRLEAPRPRGVVMERHLKRDGVFAALAAELGELAVATLPARLVLAEAYRWAVLLGHLPEAGRPKPWPVPTLLPGHAAPGPTAALAQIKQRPWNESA